MNSTAILQYGFALSIMFNDIPLQNTIMLDMSELTVMLWSRIHISIAVMKSKYCKIIDDKSMRNTRAYDLLMTMQFFISMKWKIQAEVFKSNLLNIPIDGCLQTVTYLFYYIFQFLLGLCKSRSLLLFLLGDAADSFHHWHSSNQYFLSWIFSCLFLLPLVWTGLTVKTN